MATDPARRVVIAEPLTAAAFAPFGQVLGAERGAGRDINLGTAVRFDRAARLENMRPAAEPNLAVFRVAAQTLPFTLTLLERHPHSTQAFLPLRAARWLICAVPSYPDGTPDPAGLRAFLARDDQGINLRPGVWHHPILALDEDAVLTMLAWEDGSGGDCEEHRLERPIVVSAVRGGPPLV